MSPVPATTSTRTVPEESVVSPSYNSPPSNPLPSNPPSRSTAQTTSSECLTPSPSRKPILRLELHDLSSPGTRAFLRLLHASTALEDAVDSVLSLLYNGLDITCIPPTRSIKLVLRAMDGVAYTTGLEFDDDHKEIHFSTDYISQVDERRLKEEIQGVIIHEMVHCWQHNAFGSAPGGLIEGIADWVRLKAGFAAPHWRRRADSDWDAGYERTGYFLEYLEEEYGKDVVRKINEALRGCEYDEDEFWEKCCGNSIETLWKGYQRSLAGEGDMGTLVEDTEEPGKVGATSDNDEKQQEPENASTSNDDDQKIKSPGDGIAKDTRSARVKARRGGRMHVPVRGGPGS